MVKREFVSSKKKGIGIPFMRYYPISKSLSFNRKLIQKIKTQSFSVSLIPLFIIFKSYLFYNFGTSWSFLYLPNKYSQLVLQPLSTHILTFKYLPSEILSTSPLETYLVYPDLCQKVSGMLCLHALQEDISFFHFWFMRWYIQIQWNILIF
jgi:hypothetical protein